MMQNQEAAVELQGSNEADKNINHVGIIVGLAGVLLSLLSFIYFPSIGWISVVFCVTGFFSVLLVRLEIQFIARLLVSMASSGLFFVIHGYLWQLQQPFSVALYAFHVGFCFIPVIVFNPREKLMISTIVSLTIVSILSIPYIKGYLFPESIVTTSPQLSMLLTMTAGLFLFAIIYKVVMVNYNVEVSNKKLTDAIKRKTSDMTESEDKLKAYIQDVERAHEEDRKRKWSSEGITAAIEIMRSNESLDVVYDKLIRSIVRHLRANQSGLFIVEEGEEGESYLELKACYAYEKKRFLSKRVTIGEGMLGQCYLEGEYKYITDLKQDYLNVTSGLGDAPPDALLIMPMKANDSVVGVMEIASFNHFEKYQVEFVERVCSNIASMVENIKINHHTKKLLEQSQQQMAHIHSQEEELRQNLEELMATQEEMQRKEKHLQAQADVMEFVVDNIPFPVFIKDERGCYTMVNKAETQVFNLPKSEILGFDDSKFVRKQDEMERIRESDRSVIEDNKPVHFPEQTLTLGSGAAKVFKTSKFPFFNKLTNTINILGVSLDLTDAKNMERELTHEIEDLRSKLEAIDMTNKLFSYSQGKKVGEELPNR